MAEAHTRTVPILLVCHTAVDYQHRSGVGIGLVQHAEYVIMGVNKNHRVPAEERKYAIIGQNFTSNNVKTTARAYMLAMLHAFGLARTTIKRGFRRGVQLQGVTVYSESAQVVQRVNRHIENGPDSLQGVKSANDRKMIGKVLAAVRKLSRPGLHVSISVTGNGGDIDPAGKKARTLARQKGRKACRSRHRLRLAQQNVSPVDGGPD